jgi:outer membrane protein
VGQQYELDSLLTRAFASRVDLDAQTTRVDAAEQGVKAAAASRWPTVSLTAGYNSAFNSATALGFVDQLDQRRGGSVRIGVSIPLFDRGSTRLATERAQIQADNASLTLENQRQEVALQVRRAYLDYDAAQGQLAAAQAQQRASDLAVSTSQERYRVGAATLVELTQARATQVQAASAVVSARYSLVFQQALMSYYTGELDPATVTLGN